MTTPFRWALLAVVLTLITACDASSRVGDAATVTSIPAPKAQAAAASTAATAFPSNRDVAHADEFHEFSLTIYGYNYTDTEIGSFEVNGRGGGNLAVSTATSAGGSSTCCVALFTPISKDRPIRIKWSRDGDTWCEQDVAFTGPVPLDAKYLEVHFYREGKIEVAVTNSYSEPRLKLDRLHGNSRHVDPALNVNHDNKLSRCKHGYR